MVRRPPLAIVHRPADIPYFTSELAEADFWQTHRLSDTWLSLMVRITPEIEQSVYPSHQDICAQTRRLLTHNLSFWDFSHWLIAATWNETPSTDPRASALRAALVSQIIDYLDNEQTAEEFGIVLTRLIQDRA